MEPSTCPCTVTTAPNEEPLVAIPDFSLCIGRRDEPTELTLGDHLRIRIALDDDTLLRLSKSEPSRIPRTSNECQFVRDDEQTLFVICPCGMGGIYQTLILEGGPRTEEGARTIAVKIARRFSFDAIRLRRPSDKGWATFLIVMPKVARS